MTFYEAALRVLESAGRPLHVTEITEKSVSQSLLSHVGKTPEQTMLSRLAAMARRNRDRKVIVTAKDTFALIEWGIPEDAEALAKTGVAEPNPEEDLPPYRPIERHPEPRTENVRTAGRGEKRHRRDEDDERRGKKRRYPPVPEVVFEVLSEHPEPLKAVEILEKARGRELAGEELSEQQLLTALLEDNQRRIDAGRRPQFILIKETGAIALERAGAPSEAPPVELQAAFAALLGIPIENGRPVLPQRQAQPSGAVSAQDLEALTQLKTQLKDARRNMARVLRRRLGELDAFALEKACVKMLHHFGFRELKVAKRNNLGPLLTARKREGSVELRYAIRIIKGSPGIDRKTVQDLRRDMGHYAAQVGLLLSNGDVRGDARSEAQSSGPLAMVWGGEALADKFLDAKAGVTVQTVELFEVDDAFFETIRVEAEEAQRRREERMRERQGGGGERRERRSDEEGANENVAEPLGEQAEAAASSEGAPPAAPPEQAEPSFAATDEGGDEGDEGDDDDLEAAEAYVEGGGPQGAPGQGGPPGAEGEPRRRRRRRRRGRRGRGGRPEGAPGQPGQQQAQGGAPSESSSPPPPPAPPPSSGGGSEPS